MKHKIVIAITGASGSIYAKVLLQKLKLMREQIDALGILMSDNARLVWQQELGEPFIPSPAPENEWMRFYDKNDYLASFASGSAGYDTMIICPCSMGTLGRIATGISNDLITRAADVVLKERRRLILVTRETPLSLIHINNMKMITESGGIICPASPSFYSNPKTFEQLALTVVDRVLDLAKLEQITFRWNERPS